MNLYQRSSKQSAKKRPGTLENERTKKTIGKIIS